MRILVQKPVLSCSPNARITLSFKDYIRATILKCDEGAKKRDMASSWQHIGYTAFHMDCCDPCKKQE